MHPKMSPQNSYFSYYILKQLLDLKTMKYKIWCYIGDNNMKNEISLCMIVKNEEEYLPACLKSVKDIVDEIIIVDTGSTDKTIEIARQFGAKVYYFKWNNNFSEARNQSLKYATKNWILIMDADDEIYDKDKETLKILLNRQLDDSAIYFFETLSYCGSVINDSNIAINLNPRLFRNHRGTHYEGEIHNQLIYTQNEYNIICSDIKIHHYGYLDKKITANDKRNRNISILTEQIKKDPNSKYAFFNLGNEYAALNNMEKALECYYKAYENFDSDKGYSCILLIRIVATNYDIGEYNEALKFIDIGIKYFPKCTDFYYLKAAIFGNTHRPTLQIKTLEKCIEMGEAPSELKFIYGSGSFKAYYELANAYMKLNDYDAAFNYYMETIKSKPDFVTPLYDVAKILKEKNVSIDESKKLVEKFFDSSPKAYNIIADLFYSIGYYKTALEYIEKCQQLGISTDDIMILKMKCLARVGAFHECINMSDINEKNPLYINFSMYRVISRLLTDRGDVAASLLCYLNKDNLSDYDRKIIEVYTELVKLFNGEPTTVLSKDENDKDYINIILEICEILLINNKFDELKIGVNLLNLIENKSALLYLGKLYYKYGYIDIAKKEILRSIKEFEIYDSEALSIIMT